tara:strand:- start:4497 stop:5033 length:537 start_codon:yes stop_codon:yes gene_type:complete
MPAKARSGKEMAMRLVIAWALIVLLPLPGFAQDSVPTAEPGEWIEPVDGVPSSSEDDMAKGMREVMDRVERERAAERAARERADAEKREQWSKLFDRPVDLPRHAETGISTSDDPGVGVVDLHARTAPVDSGPIAVPEADKPWYDQIWFSDLMYTAIPFVILLSLGLLVWLIWRRRYR